jgi:hypothetical protein
LTSPLSLSLSLPLPFAVPPCSLNVFAVGSAPLLASKKTTSHRLLLSVSPLSLSPSLPLTVCLHSSLSLARSLAPSLSLLPPQIDLRESRAATNARVSTLIVNLFVLVGFK